MEVRNTLFLFFGSMAFGVLLGSFLFNMPPIEVVIEVKNETSGGLYEGNFSYFSENMCCFPTDCPQAVNNPDVCTCTYMVECFEV